MQTTNQMQLWQFINNSNQLNTFRPIILPILRIVRLCVTACGIMYLRCCRPVAGNIVMYYTTSCITQSSALEDGQNNCQKYVQLTGIINKPLLLLLVGCLYYLYFLIFFENCLTVSINSSKECRLFHNVIFWFVKYSNFT